MTAHSYLDRMAYLVALVRRYKKRGTAESGDPEPGASLKSARPARALIVGLLLFGIVFAINSAAHPYLILAYSGFDKLSMDDGFRYIATAGGRLAGTVQADWTYQTQGLEGSLWWLAGSALAAAMLPFKLPEASTGQQEPAVV